MPTTATEVQTTGYFTAADTLYVIERNQLGVYARRLVTTADRSRWRYTPEGTYDLAGMAPLTIDEALELAEQRGICLVCAAPLSDRKYATRGVGARCVKRLR